MSNRFNTRQRVKSENIYYGIIATMPDQHPIKQTVPDGHSQAILDTPKQVQFQDLKKSQQASFQNYLIDWKCKNCEELTLQLERYRSDNLTKSQEINILIFEIKNMESYQQRILSYLNDVQICNKNLQQDLKDYYDQEEKNQFWLQQNKNSQDLNYDLMLNNIQKSDDQNDQFQKSCIRNDSTDNIKIQTFNPNQDISMLRINEGFHECSPIISEPNGKQENSLVELVLRNQELLMELEKIQLQMHECRENNPVYFQIENNLWSIEQIINLLDFSLSQNQKIFNEELEIDLEQLQKNLQCLKNFFQQLNVNNLEYRDSKQNEIHILREKTTQLEKYIQVLELQLLNEKAEAKNLIKKVSILEEQVQKGTDFDQGSCSSIQKNIHIENQKPSSMEVEIKELKKHIIRLSELLLEQDNFYKKQIEGITRDYQPIHYSQEKIDQMEIQVYQTQGESQSLDSYSKQMQRFITQNKNLKTQVQLDIQSMRDDIAKQCNFEPFFQNVGIENQRLAETLSLKIDELNYCYQRLSEQQILVKEISHLKQRLKESSDQQAQEKQINIDLRSQIQALTAKNLAYESKKQRSRSQEQILQRNQQFIDHQNDQIQKNQALLNEYAYLKQSLPLICQKKDSTPQKYTQNSYRVSTAKKPIQKNTSLSQQYDQITPRPSQFEFKASQIQQGRGQYPFLKQKQSIADLRGVNEDLLREKINIEQEYLKSIDEKIDLRNQIQQLHEEIKRLKKEVLEQQEHLIQDQQILQMKFDQLRSQIQQALRDKEPDHYSRLLIELQTSEIDSLKCSIEQQKKLYEVRSRNSIRNEMDLEECQKQLDTISSQYYQQQLIMIDLKKSIAQLKNSKQDAFEFEGWHNQNQLTMQQQ